MLGHTSSSSIEALSDLNNNKNKSQNSHLELDFASARTA
jgi:hypothetical protein